jgi:hypothetical protein
MWGMMSGVYFVPCVEQHLRKVLITLYSGEAHKIALAWVRIVGPRVT